MDDQDTPAARLLAVVAAPDRERIDALLRRGAYRKAIDRLGRGGWWHAERMVPVDDPEAAVVDAGAPLVSLESSGWEPIDGAAAASRLVDGYFALFVSADGTVLYADEARRRLRSA
ncbi:MULTISPECIES: hypothetical protein [unclassified Curtobacterium]|uniref:hypothetical protein n=1 Tax=unclassified Curtobacterium TaxID=257496 RepID=UPI003823A52A